MKWMRALAVIVLIGTAVAGAPSEGRATDRMTRRVLFVGNSYTRFNDLPGMVAELSRSAARGPLLVTSREARGGFNLRMHWRNRRLRQLIRARRFDVVVLQDHSLSPIEAPDEMTEYARRFSRYVSDAGARTILFQTWARAPRSRDYRRLELEGHDDMLARIDAVYAALGDELHVSVAPVGHAWRQAIDTLPRISLHRRDGTHPAMPGSYLAACVLYGTLTGLDPREAAWRPWRLSPSEGARIRAVAAASLGYD